ncbi:hypothetical protein J2803_003058 [Paraburkholderia phenoliruptrix]|nr:hypothetical protein [Paraburkholderia phenoliruptrix]
MFSTLRVALVFVLRVFAGAQVGALSELRRDEIR